MFQEVLKEFFNNNFNDNGNYILNLQSKYVICSNQNLRNFLTELQWKIGHEMIKIILFSVGNSSGFNTFVGDTFPGLIKLNEGKSKFS